MMYLPIAIEIANDRAREAQKRALVAAVKGVDFAGPGAPRRPSRVRTALAFPVHAFSDASHALSEAACSAATRIEGAR